jgi:phosphoglycerate dehydrogenase-like enzyme
VKILVPEHLLEELHRSASDAVPEVELLPYGETDDAVSGQAEAVALLRWVWGKQYARIVAQMPNIRWLHTASAGVEHVLTPEIQAKSDLIVTDSSPAFEIAISEFVLA